MKKYIFLVVLLFSLPLSLLVLNLRYKQESKIRNFSLYTVSQAELVNIDYSKILSGQKRIFEFKSKYQNLGSVEILIDNHGRINKDEITFRIKEKDGGKWLYQNNYQTSSMDKDQFYPFGFEVISDSRNKNYIVEIESIDGTEEDSISISKNIRYINIKYLYNREYLYKNIMNVPEYLSLKYIEFVKLFSFIDFAKVILIVTIPIAIIVFMSDVKFKKFFNFLHFKFKLNKGLLLISILYLVFHVKFLNYSQYWDSEWYWQLLISAVSNVINYNGNISGLIETLLVNFNFLGHPSMGYVFLLSISQFLDLGNVVLLNLTNTLLGLTAVIGFYYFVKLLFPKNIVNNLIIVGIFAFNPLFFATSISLNLDFALLVFLLLTVTSLFYKKYNLFFLFSLLLIFSKETGLLIYISILVSTLLFRPDDFKRHKYTFLIPIIIFILYLYQGNWNLWNASAVSNEGNGLSVIFSNEKMFSFGINLNNILLRFFQIFVMNFNWLMTPFIVAGLLKIKDKNFWFLVFILAPFLLFNFLYTVMPFSRYTVSSVFLIISLFYFSINKLIKNKKIIRLILVPVLVVMFIQVFMPLDPSPIILYGKNYIGKNISSPVFGYRDGLVYNTQFYFVDELSRMINKRSNKSEGIILDTGAQYFFKNINDLGTVEEIDKVNNKYRDLEYIYVPWFSSFDLSMNRLSEFYNITFKEKIIYNGYYVDIYKLVPN